MKKQLTLYSVLIMLLVLIYSCDSGVNETDEESTEAPKSETKTEIKEDIQQPHSEIKQDINKTTKLPKKTYSIQIGAFNSESNAKKFISDASLKLNFNINCVYINDYYKVRLGSFNSIAETLPVLEQVKAAGYEDSFIIEAK